MRRPLRSAGLLLGLGLVGALVAGDDRPKAGPRTTPIDFIRDVRPILEARCYSCHGSKKQRGDLRLDQKTTALKGGESGPVIVPGKSATSPLLQRAGSDDPLQRMPPTGERLT